MTEDVIVIGAGPAGIACAYYLEKAGISYKVIDRAHEIASTWNSLYPSLRLNTTRFFSHLPEKRFPLHYGIFPTGKQYHRYLVEYVREHGFNIHLNVEVYDVRPEGDLWRVDTSEGSECYKAVIACTGRFSDPIIPHIPGMESFNGEIIHAHEYTGPEPYRGRRVMVVGNGPSGIDIVTELAEYVEPPAYLSQRTGVVLRPRYPLGMPKHLWMIIADYLPDFLAKPLLKRVSAAKYPDHLLTGIKVPPTPDATSAAGGTRGRGLIRVVQQGKVKSVDGPVQFHPDSVELQGGTLVRPEVVIMATGYKPAIFRYFKQPVDVNDQGWPVREGEPPDVYWQGGRQIKGYPGLYLSGVYYQGKGAMYNFNTEAEAAVEEIKDRLATLEAAPDYAME